MSAETGVGPAMASGSQTYSGIWALFPMAPTKRRMPTTARSAKPHIRWPFRYSATETSLVSSPSFTGMAGFSTTIWSRSSRKLSVGPMRRVRPSPRSTTGASAADSEASRAPARALRPGCGA